MAIARDGSGVDGGSNGGAATHTWSHTVNGPNPILWVFARVFSGTITLTATYNGVAMTNPTNAVLIDSTNAQNVYLFCITGITGTHNVVVTASSGTPVITGLSMAFSGASQIAGQPDASGNKTQTNNTQIDNTLTTVADNCWLVLGGVDFTGPEPNAAGGSTKDIGDGGSTGLYSNGPYTPAGSKTISYTPTGFHIVNGVFASFAPTSSAAPAAQSTLTMLGVQ